jgi:hypothetical protein
MPHPRPPSASPARAWLPLRTRARSGRALSLCLSMTAWLALGSAPRVVVELIGDPPAQVDAGALRSEIAQALESADKASKSVSCGVIP